MVFKVGDRVRIKAGVTNALGWYARSVKADRQRKVGTVTLDMGGDVVEIVFDDMRIDDRTQRHLPKNLEFATPEKKIKSWNMETTPNGI